MNLTIKTKALGVQKISFKIVFTSLIILLFVACKDDSSSKSQNQNVSENQGQQDFDAVLKTDTIQLTKLSPESKNITREWMGYIALNSEIERFDDYSLQDLVNNSETILNVTDTLQQSIPEKLQTKALQARIRTLYTHARLLEENAKRNTPNAEEVKVLGAKLKRDFDNFNIQINEVFIQQQDSLETLDRL